MRLMILTSALFASFVLADLASATEVISSEPAACALVKKRISDQFTRVASCSFLPSAATSDPDILVMRLNSSRPCNGTACSNLLGWYAVRRSNGEVYEWNVGEMKLGSPLPSRGPTQRAKRP